MTSPLSLDLLGLSPSGVLAYDHAVMTGSSAAELVRNHWNLDAHATKVATEKDDTFVIEADEGRRFVLKVSNASESETEVEFQCALLEHVSMSEIGHLVPRLVPSGDGTTLLHIADTSGEQRLARLMTYMAGTPLDSTHSTAGQRERIGVVLAHLRHATEDFRHAAEDRLIPWNVVTLPALGPLLAYIDDSEHRDMLELGMARFRGLVAPELPRLRSQVLHNDFSKSNLLVDHSDPEFVTAVIDFGDAVRTPIAVDVSTALLNQLPQDLAQHPRADIFTSGYDLLRGYLAMTDLTDHELELVPHLVMGRVVARALITHYRASLIPGNTDYIMRNTEQGWAQLRWFLSHSPDHISSLFNRPNVHLERS